LRGAGSVLDIYPVVPPSRQTAPTAERAWSRVTNSVETVQRTIRQAAYALDPPDRSIIARREFDEMLDRLYRFYQASMSENWKRFKSTSADILYQTPFSGRRSHPFLYLAWYGISGDANFSEILGFTKMSEEALYSVTASIQYELYLADRRADSRFDDYIAYLRDMYFMSRIQMAIKYRR